MYVSVCKSIFPDIHRYLMLIKGLSVLNTIYWEAAQCKLGLWSRNILCSSFCGRVCVCVCACFLTKIDVFSERLMYHASQAKPVTVDVCTFLCQAYEAGIFFNAYISGLKYFYMSACWRWRCRQVGHWRHDDCFYAGLFFSFMRVWWIWGWGEGG